MANQLRKIERNIMKKTQGNNKISQEWNSFQLYRYGVARYDIMQKQNKKKKGK